MDSKHLEIRGLEHIKARLDQLEKKDARKICQSAFRSAMKPVAKSAKANAPKVSGQLSKSLKVRSLRRSRKRFGVTVSMKSKDFPDQYYGSFVEYGTKKMVGRHFLKQAFDSNADIAAGAACAKILEGLDKWAKTNQTPAEGE